DMLWADAHGGHLYVVVTGASTTWYRYSPELWMVSLDGTATPLFRDPQNNDGFGYLTVAPDERHVAYQAGFRSGCDAYDAPKVRELNSLIETPLSGLPAASPDGSVTLSASAISWSSS